MRMPNSHFNHGQFFLATVKDHDEFQGTFTLAYNFGPFDHDLKGEKENKFPKGTTCFFAKSQHLLTDDRGVDQ